MRILVAVVIAVISLTVIGLYMARRSAESAANAIARATENPELMILFKGAFGQVLLKGVRADGAAAVQPGGGLQALLKESKPTAPGEKGLLDEYRENPQKFKRDAEVFDTWFHALKVGNAIRNLPANALLPPTSESVKTLPPQVRLDAWGRSFCIFKGAEKTAVVSAGPDGKGFANCARVALTAAQIDRLPVIPITREPSGALIIIFKPEAKSRLVTGAVRPPLR